MQVTHTLRTGPVPLTIKFTDISAGSPESWIWDFGDGSGSAEQNPSHTYTAPGEYTVTLKTANRGGDDSAADTVEISTHGRKNSAAMPSSRLLAKSYPAGTVAVLHLNNAGPVEDAMGHNWFTQNLLHSDTISRFGGGSALFNGNAWLATNDTPDFSPGSENFTFSAWVYPTSPLNGYGTVWGNWWCCGVGGSTLDFYGGKPRIVYDNYGTKIITGTRPLLLNQWSNVVLQGKNVGGSSDITLYVNGRPNGTLTGAYNIQKPMAQANMFMGRSSTQYFLLQAGTCIDDFFIVKSGPALYEGPFTPPEQEFGDVTVPPQTEYKVYAEAGEPGEIYTIAKGFWDQMVIAENNGIEWNDWQSGSDIISATDARESHWNSTTNANDWIENADFAYFSGHGNRNLISFQNYDEGSGLNYTTASSMRLGYGRLKWAVLDSCESLNYTSWTNWQQSFTGLHMLLGMNTSTVPSFDGSSMGRGEVFVRLMKSEYPANTTPLKIIDAWDWAGKYTWAYEPGHSSFDVFSAVIYDTNCQNDYLPGWVSSCSATSGSLGYQTTLVFHQTGSEKTGNFKSRTLDLNAGKYTLEASVPDEDTIMVYSSKKPGYTKEWVDRLAKNLGMSGKSSETEFVFYTNNSDKDDNYFVVQKDASVISFQKFNARSGFPLSEDESVAVANRFLKENGLMSDQELEPSVTYNTGEILTKSGERKIDWRTAVVTYSRELNGLPAWNSQKMVELDSKGNIIGYFQNWRDYEPYKEIKLKSPENAFAEFQKKQALSEKESPEKIDVTNVRLGYLSKSAVATEDYLQPVYVFEGVSQYRDLTKPFAPVVISATDQEINELPYQT